MDQEELILLSGKERIILGMDQHAGGPSVKNIRRKVLARGQEAKRAGMAPFLQKALKTKTDHLNMEPFKR